MRNFILFLVIALFLIACAPDTGEINASKNLSADDILEEAQVVPSTSNEVIETPVISEEKSETSDDILETSDEIFEAVNKTNGSNSMIPNSRCRDSDVTEEFPDGINLKMKGIITVNGYQIKGGFDFCTTTSQVSEWYCQNGIPRVYVYKCPTNCADAVCV